MEWRLSGFQREANHKNPRVWIHVLIECHTSGENELLPRYFPNPFPCIRTVYRCCGAAVTVVGKIGPFTVLWSLPRFHSGSFLNNNTQTSRYCVHSSQSKAQHSTVKLPTSMFSCGLFIPRSAISSCYFRRLRIYWYYAMARHRSCKAASVSQTGPRALRAIVGTVLPTTLPITIKQDSCFYAGPNKSYAGHSYRTIFEYEHTMQNFRTHDVIMSMTSYAITHDFLQVSQIGTTVRSAT